MRTLRVRDRDNEIGNATVAATTFQKGIGASGANFAVSVMLLVEAYCETDCSPTQSRLAFNGPAGQGIYLDISVAIQRPPFSQSSRNPGGKRTAMMMTLVLEVYGVLIFSTIAFLAIAWASSRESRKQID
jgi:hypothetical protein